MFETAELDHRISKKEYKKLVIPLRQALLEVQGRLIKADFPVIIVFGGVDGGGKSETTDLLNEWMDPRWIITRAYDKPTDEERERPYFWRFWRDMPGKHEIGIFLSAWYSKPLLDRVRGGEEAEFDRRLHRILEMENMLAESGALIIKFWMHLSKEQQERRLTSLAEDPLQSWRVNNRDWEHYELYDSFIDVSEDILMRTSTGKAPWHIVEGHNVNYRSLKVGTLLLKALRRRLDLYEMNNEKKCQPPKDTLPTRPLSEVNILERMDLDYKLEKRDYRNRLAVAQGRLGVLQREAFRRGVSLVCVFEGADAAGKGGAIRRLTRGIDAKRFRVIPIAKPTNKEVAHHYLWRFWGHIPRAGRVTIYDRSWYGRVLVERVEGFATKAEWQRAYSEINHFEKALTESNTVVIKFWVHIDKDEQLRRFKEREETPHKRWKLTDEDWRNREKWDDYSEAVHEMIEQTSTRFAPWHLIPGNDKWFSRVSVIEIVCEVLEAALVQRRADPDGKVLLPPPRISKFRQIQKTKKKKKKKSDDTAEENVSSVVEEVIEQQMKEKEPQTPPEQATESSALKEEISTEETATEETATEETATEETATEEITTEEITTEEITTEEN